MCVCRQISGTNKVYSIYSTIMYKHIDIQLYLSIIHIHDIFPGITWVIRTVPPSTLQRGIFSHCKVISSFLLWSVWVTQSDNAAISTRLNLGISFRIPATKRPSDHRFVSCPWIDVGLLQDHQIESGRCGWQKTSLLPHQFWHVQLKEKHVRPFYMQASVISLCVMMVYATLSIFMTWTSATWGRSTKWSPKNDRSGRHVSERYHLPGTMFLVFKGRRHSALPRII